MYMKQIGLAKTSVREIEMELLGFAPLTVSTILRGAMRAELGGTPRGPASTHAETERQSRVGGTQVPIKMLNMQVDPEMYMKTKDRTTICPRQNMTFVPG
jgi:hypothetical protein